MLWTEETTILCLLSRERMLRLATRSVTLEQVRQRSGENSLYRVNLVSGIDQVAQGFDDRQCGSDGGFIEEVCAAAPRTVVDVVIP